MIPELICYILLGLIGGFSELLPVSATGNSRLFANILGLDAYSPLTELFIHAGVLTGLVLQLKKPLGHLYRENRLARIPAKRRRRQPDSYAVLDGRVLLGAMLPMALGLVLCRVFQDSLMGVPLCIVLWLLTGFLLYIPQFFPGGNRDSRGMSRLDGWLLGLAGGLAGLPGMSRIGGVLCAGLLRGCEQKYVLNMGLLLSVPALGLLVFMDLTALVMSGFAAVSVLSVIAGILSAGAAFAGACAAVILARHLAAGAGFSAFAYVNWGLAMFSFILYLMT